MEFLGKPVSSLFESFYAAHVAPHIPSVELTYHAIPEGSASIRGGGTFEFGYTRFDRLVSPETAEVNVRTEGPASQFEQTLAHELLHVVSGVLRFPVPMLNSEIPEDTPEAHIVRDLLTIECVANDQLLGSLGFDRDHIFSLRVKALMKAITETSAATDDLRRPWAIGTTIHYLRALLDSGPAALTEVREKLGKLPKIRERGDQMYSVITGRDLQDHVQRLRVFMLIRDTLNLRGMVAILEQGKPFKYH